MKKLFTLVAALMIVSLAMVNAQDTVRVNFTNSTTRLVDVVSDQGVYQFYGTSDDGAYIAYVAMQNVTSLVGSVTPAKMYSDYTAIYLAADTSEVEYDAFLGGNVTSAADANRGTVYTADFNFQVGSQVYALHFVYGDPYAANTENVAGDLVIYNDYWDYFESYGYYMFIAQIEATNYIFQGYFLKDAEATTGYDYAGTFTQDDVYGWGVYDATTQYTVGDVFSGSVTFAKDANNATNMTGSVLCYGDTQYNMTGTGSATSAVENVEAAQYQAYTEGNTIVLNGAEGQNAAIYDVAGRMISNSMVNSDNARFEVAAAGVYMIRVNGQTMRVIVK